MKLFAVILLLCCLGIQPSTGQTKAITLFDFKSSACEPQDGIHILRTRIIHKELKDNLLTIQIGATATCCVDFIPKAILSDQVLELDFEETGMECECSCCYEFIYQIEGITNENILIRFRNKEIEQSEEKYETFPVSYKIIDGDTLNRTDKYGLRQGIWIFAKDTLKTRLWQYEYSDDNPTRRTRLYPNGNISAEWINEKITVPTDGQVHDRYGVVNRYIEYFESGAKRKECYNPAKSYHNSYQEGTCKEWNEKGKLIYEGPYRE